MTPEELAAIRERDAQYSDDDNPFPDRRALLAHIDAIIEAVEGLADPWPVEGAAEEDPRDDWCRKRDVLALLRGTPQ